MQRSCKRKKQNKKLSAAHQADRLLGLWEQLCSSFSLVCFYWSSFLREFLGACSTTFMSSSESCRCFSTLRLAMAASQRSMACFLLVGLLS